MALTSVAIKSNARQQFPGVFSNVTVASGVKDFASIADGESASDTIAIPGVALGDMVLGVTTNITAGGLVITADVTAANTVTIRANNLSGGAIDLGSATFTVVVAKLV
jgi:hypothetical protein